MKHVAGGLLLIALVSLLAASAPAIAGERTKVTLSGHPAPHTMPIYVAQKKGWFEEEGLDIELLVYISGPPQMEAVPSNAWQVGIAGTPATITGVNAYDNVVIGYTVWDHPLQMLFVRPGGKIHQSGKGHAPEHPEIYGTTDAWRGANILVPKGTLAHLHVLSHLKALGLEESDVNIIHMEVPSAFQAFRAGEADAISVYSTFSASAKEQGWILASSAESTGLWVPSIIQATEWTAKNRPEIIQKVLNVILRGAMWCNENKEEAGKLYYEFANEEGLRASEELCMTIMDVHNTPGIAEMEKMLETNGFEEPVRNIMNFYIAAGIQTEAVRDKVLSQFDLGYLRKAIDNYKEKYAGK